MDSKNSNKRESDSQRLTSSTPKKNRRDSTSSFGAITMSSIISRSLHNSDDEKENQDPNIQTKTTEDDTSWSSLQNSLSINSNEEYEEGSEIFTSPRDMTLTGDEIDDTLVKSPVQVATKQRTTLEESSSTEDSLLEWSQMSVSGGNVESSSEDDLPDQSEANSSRKRDFTSLDEELSEESSLEQLVTERTVLGRNTDSSDDEDGRSVTRTSQSSDSQDSIEPLVAQLKRTKLSGTTWNMFKPINENTLYCKILTQPTQIREIIIDLLQHYRQDKYSVIKCIFQLFVDVCGYQNLPINELYDTMLENHEKIINAVSTEKYLNDLLKKTGKYLFMLPGNICKHFQSVICIFLHEFILIGHKGNFFSDSDFFLSHILGFVKSMASCMIRSVRHTGVIFAMKLMSAFIVCFDQVKGEMKRAEIMLQIDILFKIYVENYLIPDKKCYLLKIECTSEMLNWIKWNPNVFINKRKCLKHLLALVVDQDHRVRLSALETCEKLISTKVIFNEMTSQMKNFIKILNKRIYDIDLKIVIKTINIFTKLSSYYDLKEERKLIYRLIFHQNFLVAKSAGEFLSKFVHKYSLNPEMCLTQYCMLNDKNSELIPLLIEACLPFDEELKNWKLYINMILNQRYTTLKETLLYLMTESIYQCLKGTPTYPRQNYVTAILQVNKEDHYKVASCILTKIKELFIVFENNDESLIEIMKILEIIDYNLVPKTFLTCYIKVFNLLEKLYFSSNNKNLLEKICDVLYIYCENIHVFAGQTNTIKEKLKAKYSQIFIKDNSNEVCLKTAILYSKFNLNFKWNEVSTYLKNDSDIAQYAIICCQWYLIWKLRQLKTEAIKEDNLDDRSVNILSNNCRKFIDNTLKIIEKNNIDNVFIGFEGLFCLLFNISYEIKKKNRIMDFLQHSMTINLNESEAKILFDFIQRFVFNEETLTLNQRRIYLANIIDLLYIETVPFKNFSIIFRHYYTHFEEFGEIMNSAFNELKRINPGLPLIIMHTCAEFYNDIFKKYGALDLRGIYAKELKKLVKKISLSVQFKSRHDNLKLLHMVLNFAFSIKENYEFLYLMRYFADNLNEEGKSELYDLFVSLVPETDKNNEIILLFADYLKANKNKKSRYEKSKSTKDDENSSFYKGSLGSQTVSITTVANDTVPDDTVDSIIIEDASDEEITQLS